MVIFKDAINFSPCYSPKEMFELGIFGGSYFKLETELPHPFLVEVEGLLISENTPNKKHNRFGVLSGSSLQWWLDQKIIHPDDPNGWVEWYVKFYYGRRHQDDERQINRFRAFVSRHTGMLKSYDKKGIVSSKTNQNLLQWAWDYKILPTW